ncbi:MAG: transposase [Candidatus Pacebacteria bacterium]|jgi:hypothetical protein|nr:transposase [Candidatus Paceibacterota bacterium]
MDDTELQVLKILIDTNRTLFDARRANQSRINNFQNITEEGVEYLTDISVNFLDKALDSLRKDIQRTMVFMPEYSNFLENIREISIYDAGELIVLIKDINRFKNKNSFIYYCGLSPVVKVGKKYQKITTNNKQYGTVIGSPKQDTSKIQYNDRLNKVILKIVRKLIQYNPQYKRMYGDYLDNYAFKHPTYTMKHLKYMSQRKVATKFAKHLYSNFYKIENGDTYD